jgi:hypothetical protein
MRRAVGSTAAASRRLQSGSKLPHSIGAAGAGLGAKSVTVARWRDSLLKTAGQTIWPEEHMWGSNVLA